MPRPGLVLVRVAAFAALVGVLGCGPSRPAAHPVSGKLVYADGSSVPGRASVTFHTEVDGKTYQARGAVELDGSFQLTTYLPNDGAVAGEHKVTVAPIPGGEESSEVTVSDQYASTETSGLMVTIEPGTNAPVVNIERPKRKK